MYGVAVFKGDIKEGEKFGYVPVCHFQYFATSLVWGAVRDLDSDFCNGFRKKGVPQLLEREL